MNSRNLWHSGLMALILAPALYGVAAAAALEEGGEARIVEIIDGDTVRLADGRRLRLVGIQAPKQPPGKQRSRPRRLADKARAALGVLARGRRVRLGYGGRRLDRHDRVLAHLYLADGANTGAWLQGRLLAAGLARVRSRADNRALIARMLILERQARTKKIGIWGDDDYRVRTVAESHRFIGSFQLVEGRVHAVATVRGRVYLNYGEDWRSDFTVVIGGRVRRRFEAGRIALSSLTGRRIRVRGWIKYYNGPMIEVSHPEQIELLD